MSLLNPCCGEISDRLTILSLKILHGDAAGKDVTHFVNERNGLLTKLKGRELNGAWFDLVLQLGAVNAALWQRTDELRGYLEEYERPGDMYDWASEGQCGRAIMRLNDERARLVHAINVVSGDVPKDAMGEKL